MTDKPFDPSRDYALAGDPRHIPFAPPTRKVIVTLTRNEITYAVDFETAKVGQIAGASLEGEKKKHAKDLLTGKETKDWIDMQIESAVQLLRKKAGGMSTEYREMAGSDVVTGEKEQWDIILRVSESWMGSVHEAARLGTDYVVAYVLSRWYGMVEPSRSAMYEERAEHALNDFRDVVTRSIVRTQYW